MTAEADIGPEANHGPIETATRVWFAESHDVIKEKLEGISAPQRNRPSLCHWWSAADR
jgi:hypothetical protein